MRVPRLPGNVEPELGRQGARLGRQAVRPTQAGIPVRPVAQLRQVTCVLGHNKISKIAVVQLFILSFLP